MIWQDGGQELESFAASCMNSLLENNLKLGFKNNPTEKQASKQGSDCFGVQITEGHSPPSRIPKKELSYLALH